MIKINEQLVNEVIEQAKQSPRGRKNYNFHQTYDEVLNRMLNALEPGTYVQPHKHEDPDKHEVFIILKGKALVVEYDNDGQVTDFVVVGAGTSNFGVEIAPGVWHSIIPLASGTVVYEVKEGPYSPLNDKNFAPWAPKEGDPQCKVFNQEMLKKAGL